MPIEQKRFGAKSEKLDSMFCVTSSLANKVKAGEREFRHKIENQTQTTIIIYAQ